MVNNKDSVSRILAYLPIVVIAASLVATATASQLQISTNALAIDNNKSAITLRVPQFMFDTKILDFKERLVKIAASTESNEDVIDELERGTDKINATIELEVEKLRAMVNQSDREQKVALETILRLLEQELNSD